MPLTAGGPGCHCFEMELKEFKLKDLSPADYNPRRITPEALKGLGKSIEKFGYLEPLVVNIRGGRNRVISGHQRLKALLAQGEATAECVVVDFDDVTEKAANVALNAESISGDWDMEGLETILKELKFEFPEFDDVNLDDLADSLEIDLEDESMSSEGKDVDNVPEVEEKPVIQYGDLIELGAHRVLCGDSTKKEDVERLMDGEKADICFTSPPYNLGKNVSLSTHGKKDNAYTEYDDAKTSKDYLSLLRDFTGLFIDYCKFLFVNIQSLAGNKKTVIEYQYIFKDHIADVMVWTKRDTQPAMANNILNSAFEYILILSEKESPTRAIGTKIFRGTISNVYEGTKNHENEFHSVHSAAFPCTFAKYFIENFTDKKHLVAEPFLGTGTTLIACEKTKRCCFGMEIDSGYCQVVIQRWCDFTGKDEVRINGKDVFWNEYKSN